MPDTFKNELDTLLVEIQSLAENLKDVDDNLAGALQEILQGKVQTINEISQQLLKVSDSLRKKSLETIQKQKKEEESRLRTKKSFSEQYQNVSQKINAQEKKLDALRKSPKESKSTLQAAKNQLEILHKKLIRILQREREYLSIPMNDVSSTYIELASKARALSNRWLQILVEAESTVLNNILTQSLQETKAEQSRLGKRKVEAASEHVLRGEDKDALALYKQASAHFQTAHNRKDQGLTLWGQAQAFANLGQLNAAKEAFSEAQDCFQECGAGKLECELIYDWGNLYVEETDFNQARKLYDQGIRLAQAEGDEMLQAEGYSKIGYTWAQQGHFEQAIENYQKAIKAARLAGDVRQQLMTWIDLARLHYSLDIPQEMLRCCQEALSLVGDTTYPEDQAAVLVQATRAYKALGDRENALKNWEKAMALAQEAGYPQLLEMVNLFKPEGKHS